MRNVLGVVSLALAAAVAAGSSAIAQGPAAAPAPAASEGAPVLGLWRAAARSPVWRRDAEWSPPPAGPRPPPDTSLKHIPDSTQAFTIAQIRDYFNVGDWFPGDHPPMPDVVVHGRAPHVRGCAMCHMPNGKGRPENAPVAGLPYAYIVQQLIDFKNDLRASADPRKTNTAQMIEAAKAMTDDEIKAAADVLLVDEVDAVDHGRGGRHGAARRAWRATCSLPLPDGGTEPIGNRIIETPEDADALRAARSALRLHRLRADRQHEEGRRARRERRRQDAAVRHLPRAGPEGARSGARHRRPIAELHRAAAVGHPAGHAQGRRGRR